MQKFELKSTLQDLLDAPLFNQVQVLHLYVILMTTYNLILDLMSFALPTAFINLTVLMVILNAKVIYLLINIPLFYYSYKFEQSTIGRYSYYMSVPLFALIILMILGYAVGILGFTVGIALAGTLFLGFIVFEFKYVFYGIGFSTVLFLLGALFMQAFDLPYAPVFNENIQASILGRFFYFFIMLLCSLPHFLMSLYVSDQLFMAWRKNEAKIELLGMTDFMLNIDNRLAITKYLQYTLDAKKIMPHIEIAIIIMDIDFFKVINDNYGHPIGDEVLKKVSECLKSQLRETDRVGRYGGEEFLMVLNYTSLCTAKKIAERCREEVEKLQVYSELHQSQVDVSASFGVYCSSEFCETLDDIIHEADMCLYRAKENGRNQVAWYDHEIHRIRTHDFSDDRSDDRSDDFFDDCSDDRS